jgi:hypothetical protein
VYHPPLPLPELHIVSPFVFFCFLLEFYITLEYLEIQQNPIGTPHNILRSVKNRKYDIQKAEIKLRLITETQSWSGKSAVFFMESALTSHGSSKSNKKPSDGRGMSFTTLARLDSSIEKDILIWEMENSKEEDKLFICRIWKTLQKYNLPSPEEITAPASRTKSRRMAEECRTRVPYEIFLTANLFRICIF